MIPSTRTIVATKDVLGVPAYFAVTQSRERDSIKITIETVLPAMRWMGSYMAVWLPPRHPWKEQ